MTSTERDAPSSVRARHAAARVAPDRGSWQARILRAAGERPPRARPQRRGSPGPIPNPAVKPAFAESTAAKGCGRAGRRARGGRFSLRAQGAASPRRKLASCAPGEARRGDVPLRAPFASWARTASGLAPLRRQAPRIAEGPSPHRLGSRRRAPARGPVRRRTAVYHAPVGPQRGALSSGPFQRFGEVSASRAALRALPASFRAAGSLAGPVLLAACVGGSVWAPSRAFLRQRGSSNLTEAVRPALSRRSAVSKGLRPGCPPL